MIEDKGLPGRAVGELRDHAVPLQQARAEKFYPTSPRKRAMIDSAMFYLIGTLYRCWPAPPIRRSASRNIRARSAASDADAPTKAQGRKGTPPTRSPSRWRCSTRFFIGDKPFIGGKHPSIADIRLASTLEFLAAIDYPLPAWAKDYMRDGEEAGQRLYRARRRRARLYRLREGLSPTRPRRRAPRLQSCAAPRSSRDRVRSWQ